MRNPLRSEEAAFKLALVVIAALVLIGIGTWIDKWLGVAVVLAEVAIASWYLLTRGRAVTPPREVPAASPPAEHRVLVVANETVGGPELLREINARAAGRHARVLVVAPVPAGPLAQWSGDAGDAPDLARQRLDDSVASMRAAGLDASGELGEIDPEQAVEDAVRTFAPDELIVSTHPESQETWFEHDLPERLRQRFAIPVTHVVVELDADRP